jgi:hypothetical protein
MAEVHHLTAADLVCGRKAKPRKRPVTLDRAMRQAKKAAVAVSAATLNADGSVTLAFGENDQSQQQNNDWDTL